MKPPPTPEPPEPSASRHPEDSAQAGPPVGQTTLGKPVRPRPAAPPRGLLVLRLALVVLSVGGTLAALALWSAGHGWLAARVLAGDVLLLFVVLMAL